MDMELTSMEAYVIFNAIEARHQYVTDDFEAPQEELPHLQSAYDKFRQVKIELEINSSKTQHLQDVAPLESSNNNFTATKSPKEKINVPVCQDCKEPLVVGDDDDNNNRTDLRCPECWA